MVLLFVMVAILAGTAAMIGWTAALGVALRQARIATALLATVATAGTSLVAYQLIFAGSRLSAAGGVLVSVAFVTLACGIGGPIGWTAARPGRTGGEITPVVNGIRMVSGLATAVWVLPGSCVALFTGEDGFARWFWVLVVLAGAFTGTTLSRKRQGL